MKKKLAVITIIYENYKITEDLLLSLKKQTNQNYHLFIVDLSDNKKPINLLVKNNQKITVINKKNKGYSFGVNIGLKKALEENYEFFCIINNDTYLKNDFIEKVLSSIISHPLSIIGGKIYYAPGFEYFKDKYDKNEKDKIIWYAGGKIDWKNVYTKHIGVDQIDKGQFDQVENTDFITGCLIAYSKKVLKTVGFWDEKYFLYYEDADYCQKAKKNNISLIYNPSIVIWHKNAQSTGGPGSKIHEKYQKKGRLRFGLKYAPLKTKLHLIKNLFYKSF